MSRMSKTAAVRAGGILGGAGLLFVGGVLIASSPAFADNGPHVSMTTTDTSALTSGIGGALGGGCASCHRAHTAKAATDLLVTTDEVALCETCHGATGNGATTDVVDGVGYGADVNGNRTGAPIGALRGGGFTNAAIDATNATRGYVYANGADWRISKGWNSISPKLALGSPAPAAATSNHGVGSLAPYMWGNGAFSAVSANYGKTGVTLECSSCHNPHGNGNFRILNPVPTDSGVVMPTISAATVSGSDLSITLSTAYPFAVGQTVTITNATPTTWNVSKGTITAVTNAADYATTFNVSAIVVKAATPPVVAWTSGGTVAPQFPDVVTGTPAPLTITAAAWTATTKYIAYTVAANTLPVGRLVTVTGFANTAYNVVNAPVVATSATSFSVAVATNPGTATGTGSAQSAAVAYNYTTQNYWQNDPNGQAPTNTLGKDSYIANVSQWCSTCHTRYLTVTGGRTNAAPDAVYTYRHTSANGTQDSPNCIQCHVAHGTNAPMSGVSNSSAADSPGASPNGDHSSKLLRVANRGVCQLCHDK